VWAGEGKMKSKEKTYYNHFVFLFFFLIFVIVLFAVLSGSLLKENATLKAIPATPCPRPIVTMEQLEQAGYQTDGDVFIKISKQE